MSLHDSSSDSPFQGFSPLELSYLLWLVRQIDGFDKNMNDKDLDSSARISLILEHVNHFLKVKGPVSSVDIINGMLVVYSMGMCLYIFIPLRARYMIPKINQDVLRWLYGCSNTDMLNVIDPSKPVEEASLQEFLDKDSPPPLLSIDNFCDEFENAHVCENNTLTEDENYIHDYSYFVPFNTPIILNESSSDSFSGYSPFDFDVESL